MHLYTDRLQGCQSDTISPQVWQLGFLTSHTCLAQVRSKAIRKVIDNTDAQSKPWHLWAVETSEKTNSCDWSQRGQVFQILSTRFQKNKRPRNSDGNKATMRLFVQLKLGDLETWLRASHSYMVCGSHQRQLRKMTFFLKPRLNDQSP